MYVCNDTLGFQTGMTNESLTDDTMGICVDVTISKFIFSNK